VLDVVTLGLGTPATIALAALSGTFYGAGISAITYSVFNFDDFSWRDYGLQTLFGALGGAVSGAFASGATIAAEAVAARTTTAIAARAGEEAISTATKVANFALKTTNTVAKFISEPGTPSILRDIAVGVAKSEALGISKNTAVNLATGNDWDTGLGQTVFSSALSGSIGGTQIKLRTTISTRTAITGML